MESSEFDAATDWSDHGPGTGLIAPMQYLGLDGGGGDSAYPERPGEPDCIYFLRTGSCGYGTRCRFNHPHDRAVVYGSARDIGGDFPERAGQPVCQHYLRTGSCKFGFSCKYHHPRHGDSSAASVNLNSYGYPLRPGEKECSYYSKTGQCKFGVTCKFDHPQSVSIQESAASSPATAIPGPAAITPSIMFPTIPHASAPSQQFGVMSGNWQVARPPMVPGSYIQGPYGPILVSTGVVPVPGWTPYMTSINALPPPSVQSAIRAGQVYGMPPMPPAVPLYNGTYTPMLSSAGQPGPPSIVQNEASHPERPGHPVCQHFLRTGECKYGAFCRYHHPTEWSGQKASFTLSPMGLPLRPGAPTCIHFTQHGVCRFGPTCKFNHPMGSLSYSPSASSLSDMPVAPYPVGSSIATLAPSSSSSDLRIDAVSGSKNSPSKTSSLSSFSSGNVLSRCASIPQSG
ncbi:hypothetical protein V2J09_015851 [Rumex salicifolius]